ncbi:MAG: hypothetical protein K2W96_27965 [Gemmataceae bacterium]|nr:hypothetical protein [Gemmataceae bacterium]
MRHSWAVLLLAGVARADMMPAGPVPERAGRADAVVVGKVVALEGKSVELPWSPGGKEKAAFQVAEVEVTERLAGSVPGKKLKLAYLPPGRRGTPFRVEKGKEGLLFLTRVHGTSYWRAEQYYDAIGKEGNPGFAGNVDEARRAGRLLADPMKALKSKDAAERALAAGLLITRWRTVPHAEEKARKQEAVSAELSKLVLEGLAEADWKKPEYSQFAPRQLFLKLGLTEKDGWKVKDFKAFEAEAKAWLKDNAGKHRLKKWTTGDTAEP